MAGCEDGKADFLCTCIPEKAEQPSLTDSCG